MQLCFSGRKGTGILNDDFFKDFNMDDIDLSLENFEQLFGTGNLFESGDAHDADIKTHCAFASEVLPLIHSFIVVHLMFFSSLFWLTYLDSFLLTV